VTLAQKRDALAALDDLRQVARLDLRQLESEIVAMLEEWQAFLHGHVQQTRQVLRKLLATKFAFTPTTSLAGQRGYEFESRAVTDRIIAGLVSAKSVVSPTGFERLCTLDFGGVLP
jgi:hypothetical protein